jgi:hypothetical protein
VSITWVIYVITWVLRGLPVKNGAHCCKKIFTIGQHKNGYSSSLCVPRPISNDHGDHLPLMLLLVLEAHWSL